MPKVVSRFAISSSESAQKTSSSKAVLRSYYCLCGDFAMVIQGKIDRLPRRKTDGSYIIRSLPGKNVPARKFKLNAAAGDRCLIQRKDNDKLEKRQPFLCNRCNLTIAYQSGPPPAGTSPFLYILPGALTETQGQVPDEAFGAEDDVLDPTDLANELEDLDPQYQLGPSDFNEHGEPIEEGDLDPTDLANELDTPPPQTQPQRSA